MTVTVGPIETQFTGNASGAVKATNDVLQRFADLQARSQTLKAALADTATVEKLNADQLQVLKLEAAKAEQAIERLTQTQKQTAVETVNVATSMDRAGGGVRGFADRVGPAATAVSGMNSLLGNTFGVTNDAIGALDNLTMAFVGGGGVAVAVAVVTAGIGLVVEGLDDIGPAAAGAAKEMADEVAKMKDEIESLSVEIEAAKLGLPATIVQAEKQAEIARGRANDAFADFQLDTGFRGGLDERQVEQLRAAAAAGIDNIKDLGFNTSKTAEQIIAAWDKVEAAIDAAETASELAFQRAELEAVNQSGRASGGGAAPSGAARPPAVVVASFDEVMSGLNGGLDDIAASTEASYGQLEALAAMLAEPLPLSVVEQKALENLVGFEQPDGSEIVIEEDAAAPVPTLPSSPAAPGPGGGLEALAAGAVGGIASSLASTIASSIGDLVNSFIDTVKSLAGPGFAGLFEGMAAFAIPATAALFGALAVLSSTIVGMSTAAFPPLFVALIVLAPVTMAATIAFIALGGAVGALIGGLGYLVTKTETFSLVQERMGDLFDVTVEAIEPFAEALLINTGIAEDLFEALKVLARAIIAVAVVLGPLFGATEDQINKMKDSARKIDDMTFEKSDAEKRAESAEARRAWWLKQNTDALREFSRSYTNVPTGFRGALAVFNSTPMAGAGAGAGGNGLTISGPVTFVMQDADVEQTVRRKMQVRGGYPVRRRGGSGEDSN